MSKLNKSEIEMHLINANLVYDVMKDNTSPDIKLCTREQFITEVMVKVAANLNASLPSKNKNVVKDKPKKKVINLNNLKKLSASDLNASVLITTYPGSDAGDLEIYYDSIESDMFVINNRIKIYPDNDNDNLIPLLLKLATDHPNILNRSVLISSIVKTVAESLIEINLALGDDYILDMGLTVPECKPETDKNKLLPVEKKEVPLQATKTQQKETVKKNKILKKVCKLSWEKPNHYFIINVTETKIKGKIVFIDYDSCNGDYVELDTKVNIWSKGTLLENMLAYLKRNYPNTIFTTTEALNYNLINMSKFVESRLLFNPDFNYNEESKNIIPWAMDEVSDPSNTPPCKEVKPEEELPALKTQHKIINENKIICVEGSHGKYNKKLKCFITDFTYDYLVNMLVINVVGKDLINMQAAIDLALSLDSEASNVMVYLNRELDISYSIIHGKWVSKLHKK